MDNQQPSVTPFQREHRYIVIKRKELTEDQESRLNIWLNNEYVRRIGCVVIEDDWPEYEPVWEMLERRVTGQSPQSIVTQALLPCPFCGGEPARHTLNASDGADNEGGDVICCTKCQASSHVEFGRKENLVSRWNTRHREASTAELRAENERLRHSLGWAIAQIEGRTRYERVEQFHNCLKIARAALSTTGVEGGVWGEARPMSEWDKRDEMVLLLVKFDDHSTDDAQHAITIGANNDHNVGDGEGEGWKFAGWCWCHDHFTEGKGEPVGWWPLPHAIAQRFESQASAAGGE